MKINFTLNRPKWLGDDVGCLYRTVTVTESTANYVVDNGRKIIPSGTLIVTPSVSGLLLNDCDVTDGERVAQILVRGAYIDSKLPTSVEGSKTLLSNQGLFAIKYAETVIPSGDNGGGSGGSGDLTPFRVGQTINGVTIDPNAKSVEEISNWINTLPYDGSPLLLVKQSDGQWMQAGTIALVQTESYPMTIWITLSERYHILFAQDSYTAEGMMIPKGWSYLDERDGVITPITGSDTYYGDIVNIATIAEDFKFLNGIVLGVVEA